MSDREQAYELVASQPEISLDAATVREIVEEYNCDDSPHFLATVHLAESVIRLERALRVFMYLTSDESGWGTNKRMEGSQLYTEVHEARRYADAALEGK